MYYFFCASLPVLELNAPAPLTVVGFDELAAGELPEEQYAALTAFNGIPRPGDPEEFAAGVYGRMARFEQYLRTQIARRRGAVELPDPAEYFGAVDYGMTAALAAPDPAAREQVLDRMRWEFLDDLALMHDFDFDALCIYRLRLTIVNKYRGRDREDGRRNFAAAAERICGNVTNQ